VVGLVTPEIVSDADWLRFNEQPPPWLLSVIVTTFWLLPPTAPIAEQLVKPLPSVIVGDAATLYAASNVTVMVLLLLRAQFGLLVVVQLVKSTV
jgi:hypothetical protein